MRPGLLPATQHIFPHNLCKRLCIPNRDKEIKGIRFIDFLILAGSSFGALAGSVEVYILLLVSLLSLKSAVSSQIFSSLTSW